MSTKTVCRVKSRNWLILGAVSSAFEQMEESAMIDRTFFQHGPVCYRLCHRPHEACESTRLDVDGSSKLAAEARCFPLALSLSRN